MAFGIPLGEQGPKGDKGDTGNTGPSGTITSATATGLAAGASPTVTLGGTPQARTMAFGIPRGDKGDKGDKGDTGDVSNAVIRSGLASRVYGTTAAGAETTLPYSPDPSTTPGIVPTRTAGGHINVPQEPSNGGYAASKKYVDDSISAAAPIDTGWLDITFETSGDGASTGSNAQARQIGKSVFYRGNFTTPGATGGTYIKVGNVPVGIASPAVTSDFTYVPGISGGVPVTVRVQSNGSIYIRRASTSGSATSLASVSYPVG